MKRSVLLWMLLLALSLSLTTVFVSATTYPAEVVFDDADLLDEQEEQAIASAAHAVREETECAFYVATYRAEDHTISLWDDEDDYIGEEFLRDHGLSDRANIVLLIVTLDDGEYYYDMYTYGDAYRRITDTEVDYVLDDPDVFDAIKGGRLEAGICSFLSLSATAYNGRLGVSYVVIAAVSAVIALIIGFAVCAGVKKKYEMKTRSVDYPLDRFTTLELTEQSDIFAGSFVTKRVIQSSSGGGGSSHGGGGGHRGGR